MELFSPLQQRCAILAQRFIEIPAERKLLLQQLAQYVKQQQLLQQVPQLLFVCTHNSRRSHLAQVWTSIAALYYGVEVHSFSAGTEATAFHPNAILALEAAGCRVRAVTQGPNPRYEVQIGPAHTILCFSKTLQHAEVPKTNFAAIMTCSEADAGCPVVLRSAQRIALKYHDPKAYDNTILEQEMYIERSNQIALEQMYVVAQVVP